MLTERRADGRRRVRLAGGKLQLDETGDLLCTDASFAIATTSASTTRSNRYAFSTCAKSSSTGVARPKMQTSTRSFCFSGLHLFDDAGEVRERAVDDAHLLALFERDARLGLGRALGHLRR